MFNITFCLIKTCALIKKESRIKRIFRSYLWKNYQYFNWNRSFIWPTLHFAWLKLKPWSWTTPNTVLNLWLFRRLSTLNASQTWLQSNEYFAHIREKMINISTEIGHLYAPKKYFAWFKTCALISKSLYCSVELVTFSPVVNAQC